MRLLEVVAWGCLLVAIGLFVVTVAGCDLDTPRSIVEWKLEDGRTVTCLRVGHGVSCDWENAR